MSVQMVHFTADPQHVPDIEDGIGRLFAAVATARPEGMRYLAARHADRPEFVLLLELAGGVPNPLPAIPEAAALRERMAAWAGPAAAPQPLDVLGNYRLLG
jgi:hypothetical protein